MIANTHSTPKPRFKVTEGCQDYNCRRCIHRSARPCLLATFNPIDTTVIYESQRTPHKISMSNRLTHSTKYNYE